MALLACGAVDQPRQEFAEAYDDHVWDVYGYLGYRVGIRADGTWLFFVAGD